MTNHTSTTHSHKQFVQNVKKARKTAGLSQERLSIRAGLHRAYITKLEAGKSQRNPDLGTIVAIAKALGISLSDLLHNVI